MAPLVSQRHEWLQEQQQLRKRQSISEEDLVKLKQDKSLSLPNQWKTCAANTDGITPAIASVSISENQKHVNNNTSFNGHKSSTTTRTNSSDEDDNDNTTEENDSTSHNDRMIHNLSLVSVESLDKVERSYLGDARRHEYDYDHQEHDATKQQYPEDHHSNHANNNNNNNNNNNDANNQNDGRQQHQQPYLERHNSDATQPHRNTTTTSTTTSSNSSHQNQQQQQHYHHQSLVPMATLKVADSTFLGFATTFTSKSTETNILQRDEWITHLRKHYPDATHIPYAWVCSSSLSMASATITAATTLPSDDASYGWEDDGEPVQSTTGRTLLQQLQHSRQEMAKVSWLYPEEAGGQYCVLGTTSSSTDECGSDGHGSGMAIAIVRYFGTQLLGVTCGRLTQCYQRVAQLTLHRLWRGYHVPQLLDLSSVTSEPSTIAGTASTVTTNTSSSNLYGLAAGDTELHHDIIVQGNREELMRTLLSELDFGGFKGAAGEVLPRLQNLQSDFYDHNNDQDDGMPKPVSMGTILPVYRYPGNYQGDEWETFSWSPTSLHVKSKVEEALPHFYNNQKMNHCVTNFYRHGNDYIAHHSDKDLDLDRQGAIVSVSIGGERVLELRRRAEPRDLTRVLLPHGSMLLLGPVTNKYFTHSILPVVKDDNDKANKMDLLNTASSDGNNTPAFEDGARISLTLRNVKTFMDSTSQRLYGQGVKCKTLQDLKRSQRWERISFILGFGSLVHYAMQYHKCFPSLQRTLLGPAQSSVAYSSRGTLSSCGTTVTAQSLLRDSITLLGSISVALWSYTKLLKLYYKRREERAAREFFTKTSTSGTRY